MKKKLKRIGLTVLILVSITAFIGIHYVAPYAIIKPPRVHLDMVPEDFDVESETVCIAIDNTIELTGYLIPSNTTETRGILIFVHGIGGCKEHFIPLAAKLAKTGIASIVFDGRAHGESGGQYCTYGFYEKKDIKKIVDFIKSRNIDVPLGIWGNSLGGAIAIQALEYDKRIEFGIIESTFSALDQIVYDYKKRVLKGIGIKSVSNYALDRAGEIASFDPSEVKPIRSVTHIDQAVFIAHGDADKNISFAYGQQLFKQLKTIDKTWFAVKGAGHLNLSEKGGEAYKSALFNFIDQHVDQ